MDHLTDLILIGIKFHQDNDCFKNELKIFKNMYTFPYKTRDKNSSINKLTRIRKKAMK